MANVHILRLESVTPIGRYLSRSDAEPATYAVHVDLATALLYREAEYRAMYLSGAYPNPGPHANSPFPSLRRHLRSRGQSLVPAGRSRK
jgi:hypothetical protein